MAAKGANGANISADEHNTKRRQAKQHRRHLAQKNRLFGGPSVIEGARQDKTRRLTEIAENLPSITELRTGSPARVAADRILAIYTNNGARFDDAARQAKSELSNHAETASVNAIGAFVRGKYAARDALNEARTIEQPVHVTI